MVTKEQYNHALEIIKKYRNQINNEVDNLLISNDTLVIDLPFDFKYRQRILNCLLDMYYRQYKDSNSEPENKYVYERKYFNKLKSHDIFGDSFRLYDLKRTRNFGNLCLKEFERVKKLYV